MITYLYCRFPDRETALEVARALTGNTELEDFSTDGWYEGTYWNIDVVFGTGEIPEQTGFHINGAWRGAEETITPALAQFRVFPENPVCVFG